MLSQTSLSNMPACMQGAELREAQEQIKEERRTLARVRTHGADQYQLLETAGAELRRTEEKARRNHCFRKRTMQFSKVFVVSKSKHQ